jgi:hypothetical protein
VPLLLAVFLISLTGFRIWGLLRNWRFLVETQLRLDRCVGQVAQDFRDVLNKIEKKNERIGQLRLAIKMAEIEPWLIPPLQALLIAQVAQQEIATLQWNLKRGHWLIAKGCGKPRDKAHPLPALEFLRGSPDGVGPQELRWEGIMPKKFDFQVMHRPRYAAAKVERESNEENTRIQSTWKAKWNVPQKFDWTNFY